MSIIEAIILAIIEGLTEFLPVSSTGHMIIATALMGIQPSAFVKLFTIVIQLGTILSVLVLYYKRFFRFVVQRLYWCTIREPFNGCSDVSGRWSGVAFCRQVVQQTNCRRFRQGFLQAGFYDRYISMSGIDPGHIKICKYDYWRYGRKINA